jgi:hypothetical protein
MENISLFPRQANTSCAANVSFICAFSSARFAGHLSRNLYCYARKLFINPRNPIVAIVEEKRMLHAEALQERNVGLRQNVEMPVPVASGEYNGLTYFYVMRHDVSRMSHLHIVCVSARSP